MTRITTVLFALLALTAAVESDAKEYAPPNVPPSVELGRTT